MPISTDIIGMLDRDVLCTWQRMPGIRPCSSPESAATLVRQAADLMCGHATDLDHAIWRKNPAGLSPIDPDDETDVVLDDTDEAPAQNGRMESE